MQSKPNVLGTVGFQFRGGHRVSFIEIMSRF